MSNNVLPDPLNINVVSPDPLPVLIKNTPISEDYYLEVSRGNVPGVSHVSKFGENPDIDNALTYETIWDGGGIYVPPTQSRIHDIVSSDVSDVGVTTSSGTATGGSTLTLEDTSATFVSDGVVLGDLVLNDSSCSSTFVLSVTETLITFIGPLRSSSSGAFGDEFISGSAYRVVQDGGLGAAVIYIQGHDAIRNSINEYVVLNGITNVPTVYSYVRQRRASAFGSFTSTGMVGTVTSTAQVDGTISCQIINGNNQTLMAIDTVSADGFAYLNNWWGTLSGKSGATVSFHLRVGSLDGIGYIQQTRAIQGSGTSDFKFEFSCPLQIPPGADIWIEASSDTNDTSVSAGFEYVKVEI